MNPKDWQFPMACPRCASEKGNPVRVLTNDSVLTVEVRCGDCRHEWALSEPSPAIFLKAEGDRRKSRRLTLVR
jgi:hypothetical protein